MGRHAWALLVLAIRCGAPEGEAALRLDEGRYALWIKRTAGDLACPGLFGQFVEFDSHGRIAGLIESPLTNLLRCSTLYVAGFGLSCDGIGTGLHAHGDNGSTWAQGYGIAEGAFVGCAHEDFSFTLDRQ